MADPKLLELLAQGREAWNQHRLQRVAPNDRLDLEGADLRGRDLSEFHLGNVQLSRSDLSGARLIGAVLDHAVAESADFTDADLSAASLQEATFRRARCHHTRFADVRAYRSSFVAADVADAHFTRADLRGSDFWSAVLKGTSFAYSHLNLARFQLSTFDDTDFEHAIFTQTSVGLSDLTHARGLADIRHLGPSAIDVHTLLRSRDLPEEFLKGVGLPGSVIAYYTSLAGSAVPIQFYSCFISYSSKDEEFCRRLHTDLQAAGVRCWFAPEDLKIGDRSRTRIEESIRIYDKLLIVLSHDSISSPWVEHEIEAAFEKERQRKATVLFPIRVDAAVMDTDQAWAASIRRERHIGNFTAWKDHDSYKKAFERLMRDLRASGEPAIPGTAV